MNALLTTHIRQIHVPLMCLVDYRGHRMLVSTFVPVDKSTILAGSHDAAHVIHHSHEAAETLLSRIAGISPLSIRDL